MAKAGRKSTFTQKIADDICERLAQGESLRKICESADMPAAKTVRCWLSGEEPFRIQYARAREDQAEHFADEIVEISDEETDTAKARNRIDARKWAASKLAPKKYGDKQNIGFTDAEGNDRSFTVNLVKPKGEEDGA